MKNLYPKSSKGRIHPSPPQPGAAAGDALAVLKLLPAAIFALTAALAAEDREVVAYLMTRSISGTEERRRCCGGGGGKEQQQHGHRAAFDCGCFECYTWFWSRWDCSRDREAIHAVIEAFEEHLARKEKKEKESKKEAKRRKKKAKDEACKSGEKEKNEVAEKAAPLPAAEENKGFEAGEAVSVSEASGNCEEAAGGGEKEEEVVAVSGREVVESPGVSGEKPRRGWADVMGAFNSRLWNLWSPGP